jgi:hypothetical protein
MSLTGSVARRVAKGSIGPYIDQALHDEELRERAQKAYVSGQSVYAKLRKEPDLRAATSRLASDQKLQKELRATLAEVKGAARRMAKRPSRRRRMMRMLVLAAGVGVAVFGVKRRAARARVA